MKYKRFKNGIILFTSIAIFFAALSSLAFIVPLQQAILIKNVDLRALINDDEILFGNSVEVSPNKVFVAFVTTRNLGLKESTIWVVNRITLARHEVASGFGEYNYVTSPTWSPDSTRLAYFSANPHQIRTVNVDGSETKTLTDNSLLYPPIGFGGAVYLSWGKDNLIYFDNSAQFGTRRFALTPSDSSLAQVSEAKVAGVINTGSENSFPLLSQNDQRWASQQLGSCDGITIAQSGCVIAAVAMLYEYYGIDATPESINAMLTYENQGYANGCDARWDLVQNYHQGITFQAVFHYDATWERLNQELNSGHPVIVGMDKHNHWVLVTHRVGDTYYINDPRGEELGRKTLADYGSKFEHMVIYWPDGENNIP